MNDTMLSGHAAALLAGGRSVRMGTDKAFIPWHGRPLWEFQLEKLRSTGPAAVLLSARREQPFPASADVTRVPDQWPDCGPLGGLASCLIQCRAPLLLVLGVDLPLVTPELLNEVLARSTPACGVVPWRPAADCFEPLAAVYPVALLPSAASAIAAGSLALQGFIRSAIAAGQLRALPVSEPAAQFANLNAPSDLLSARPL